MKIIMSLSIVIGLLVASFSIAFGKTKKLRTINIQKEVVIKGTLDEVFDQVVYLKNFPHWSPFLEADPSQKIEIKGADGEIGAQYHWVGNKGKDVGYQEIKEIKPLEYIRIGCDILKPFAAQPVFEYSFLKMGDEVKVTQNFNLKSSSSDAFFMWLFGVKKKMEKTNERGLELLKISVER